MATAKEVQPRPERLTPAELRGMFWRWTFFNMSAFSMERMQAIAYVHMMAPLIKKYCKTKEEIAEICKRHLAFFNTEPQTGTIIHGAVIAMEEERAMGAPIPDDAINGVKAGLMGPMAGVGDSMVPGMLIPILLSVAMGMSADGSLLGPIFYAVTYLAIILGVSYWLFMKSYQLGVGVIDAILGEGKLQRLTEAFTVLGLTVVGGVTASTVTLTTPLKYVSGEMTIEIQAMLDKIFPRLLPLALTLLLWWLMARKGKSATWAIGFCLLLSVVGVLLKVF